jgi:hypothetical protein
MADAMWKRLAGSRFMERNRGEGPLRWLRVDEALAWLRNVDPQLLSDHGFDSITPALVLQICSGSHARVQFKQEGPVRPFPPRTELLVAKVVCHRKYAVELCRAGLPLDACGPLSRLESTEKKGLLADTGPLETGQWLCLTNGEYR